MNLLLQSFGLILLIIGMGIGNWLWIRPHKATLTTQGRGLLLLVVATLVGGFIGSPFWWTDQPLSFSWDLPPLASRMLGAAGWSFFAVALMALRRPTTHRLRLILILLLTYLAPLALLVLLFHLQQFNFASPITYVFFIIVLGMISASAWYLRHQPTILDKQQDDTRPALVVTQVWLWIVVGITSIWGVALIITANGPIDVIWAWPNDLLSSRLIGVMLLTLAAGSLYAYRYADTARMMLVMIFVYSLGITLAAVWNLWYARPIQPLYISVFGAIFLVTAVLVAIDRPHHLRQPRTNLARKMLIY